VDKKTSEYFVGYSFKTLLSDELVGLHIKQDSWKKHGVKWGKKFSTEKDPVLTWF